MYYLHVNLDSPTVSTIWFICCIMYSTSFHKYFMVVFVILTKLSQADVPNMSDKWRISFHFPHNVRKDGATSYCESWNKRSWLIWVHVVMLARHQCHKQQWWESANLSNMHLWKKNAGLATWPLWDFFSRLCEQTHTNTHLHISIYCTYLSINCVYLE